ncbi:hypothetical protein [Actinophytocola sp.]|uniref:hypothetical protein n=1 Tax=Actinophytocola sp. TaxID=1872138 RepID=UPI003D6B258D
MGAWSDRGQGRCVAPSEATLRRALTLVDADELDTAVATWITSRVRWRDRPDGAPNAIAVDGTSLRGTVRPLRWHRNTPAGRLVHGGGLVAGQRQVAAGPVRSPGYSPCWTRWIRTRLVVTADAPHTTADHAGYLTSRVRTGQAPRTMATPRKPAISACATPATPTPPKPSEP